MDRQACGRATQCALQLSRLATESKTMSVTAAAADVGAVFGWSIHAQFPAIKGQSTEMR